MIILFTRNDNLSSKIVRFVVGEDVSHVALQIGPFVVHSDLFGIKVEHGVHYLQKNQVVRKLIFKNTVCIDDIVNKHWDKKYDFKGMLYLGWRAMLKKIFRIPFPDTNRFGKDNAYMCTEVLEFVRYDRIAEALEGVNLDTVTPHQLYKILEPFSIRK